MKQFRFNSRSARTRSFPSSLGDTMADAPTVRPRIGGEREQEILSATIAVLLEVGYDKLTFDLVATAAKASKATLYRRWSSKAELVMQAVSTAHVCTIDNAPLPDTGTLSGDLAALLLPAPPTVSIPDAVGALAPALQRNDELRERFVSEFVQPRVERYRAVLAKAQARGEITDDADIDLLAHVVPAMAGQHSLVYGSKPTTEWVRHVVEHILLPAATASRPNP